MGEESDVLQKAAMEAKKLIRPLLPADLLRAPGGFLFRKLFPQRGEVGLPALLAGGGMMARPNAL
jgi:hypothetical protein